MAQIYCTSHVYITMVCSPCQITVGVCQNFTILTFREKYKKQPKTVIITESHLNNLIGNDQLTEWHQCSDTLL